MVLCNRNTAIVSTDSKRNLTSLYFTADAMISSPSDVEETLFQNQGCIVHMLFRLLLELKKSLI